jgi:hypothetical protein
VEFHPNFVPGSFQATMDGTDWTSRFAPSPAPGGTSTAKATTAYVGGTTSGFGGPYQHRLEVASKVNPDGSGYALDKERRVADFYPPQVRFFPNSFTLVQNGSASANVCLQPPPGAPVAVVLTPKGGAPVSLNGNTLGVPITLAFPVVTTTQSCVPLTVTAGTVKSSFIVEAASVGCQLGAVSGFVQ